MVAAEVETLAATIGMSARRFVDLHAANWIGRHRNPLPAHEKIDQSTGRPLVWPVDYMTDRCGSGRTTTASTAFFPYMGDISAVVRGQVPPRVFAT